jgi:hypothetical protein
MAVPERAFEDPPENQAVERNAGVHPLSRFAVKILIDVSWTEVPS